jgi:hypothetical protein
MTMTSLEATHLTALLLASWPKLKWRRHGIGLVQAYVCEGADHEVRVHVWHPRLLREGIRDHGDVHDHRFSFVSTVLVGEITNRIAHVWPQPDNGEWQVNQVAHARINPTGAFVAEPMTVVPGPLVATASIVGLDFTDQRVRSGESYRMQRGVFHSSITHELTVTVITKYDQIDAGARVISRRGTAAVEAFNADDMQDPIVQRAILDVLDEAHLRLRMLLPGAPS